MAQGATVRRVSSANHQETSNPILKVVRYDDDAIANGPVPSVVKPPSPSDKANRTTTQRPWTSQGTSIFRFKPRSALSNDVRRDSGLAPTTSTVRNSVISSDDVSIGASNKPAEPIATNLTTQSTTSLPPNMREGSSPKPAGPARQTEGATHNESTPGHKSRISMDFGSGNLLGLDSMDDLSFSKRGSILLGGKKANGNANGHRRLKSGARHRDMIAALQQSPSSRGLSADEEQLSQRVRAMYEYGDPSGPPPGQSSDMANSHDIPEEAIGEGHGPDLFRRQPAGAADRRVSHASDARNSRRASGLSRRRESVIQREEHEIAGGMEDWEDIDGRDVDRYGFIVPRRATSAGSPTGSTRRSKTPEMPTPQRVSTILQMASEAPRRKRTLRRTPSITKTTRSATLRAPSRGTSRISPGTAASMDSYQGSSSHSSSHKPLRYAANRLPGRRNRRLMDEAGDMLTLPPGLADIAEDEEGGKMAIGMKRKEWERAEKWRKMAKSVEKGKDGEGMTFDFDTHDPKVISRTWKGIPDRWRAAAWHAFLTTSARKRKNHPTDGELIDAFYDLLEQSSADDVQIDLDVPRTINSHVMFRRRYRGGQRLLFRILHALSLYFPEVGYVQGMASLAATLLCYYDEELAFVMLVRLWQLRGLERLYRSGFGGLMEALEEFEKKWLAGGDVAPKLVELGIGPTAYGTRWYLTLFNYSIPFPAQLRVWDVFMLLGDGPPSTSPTAPPQNQTNTSTTPPATTLNIPVETSGGLDVLHATSAALIDGTREILLDSDFENAMKVLTSWIPIRDEDLLMKVAKAEWKKHRRRG
ncbi:MAG: hypothetical protein M4579_000947 [Chaenotheca gracillima]|nr:MAG: hypothetical protein M4579_000947 [Chaenotheca gracillima]